MADMARPGAAGVGPRMRSAIRRDGLLRPLGCVLTLILRLGPLEDVEGLGDRASVLVGGALQILVGDVGFAHLEVGVHAAARQAHVEPPGGPFARLAPWSPPPREGRTSR